MKDLPRKTASDKVLHDKAFTIAKTQYDDYQMGLASMVYNFFFDKKSSDGAATHGSSEMTAMRDTQDKSAIENKTMPNQE